MKNKRWYFGIVLLVSLALLVSLSGCATPQKGDKGDDGATGEQGIQGIQGEKGEKGDKGDRGNTGEQGIQGIQGIPGKDGRGIESADYSKITGKLTITYTDGFIYILDDLQGTSYYENEIAYLKGQVAILKSDRDTSNTKITALQEYTALLQEEIEELRH